MPHVDWCTSTMFLLSLGKFQNCSLRREHLTASLQIVCCTIMKKLQNPFIIIKGCVAYHSEHSQLQGRMCSQLPLIPFLLLINGWRAQLFFSLKKWGDFLIANYLYFFHMCKMKICCFESETIVDLEISVYSRYTWILKCT